MDRKIVFLITVSIFQAKQLASIPPSQMALSDSQGNYSTQITWWLIQSLGRQFTTPNLKGTCIIELYAYDFVFHVCTFNTQSDNSARTLLGVTVTFRRSYANYHFYIQTVQNQSWM